MTHPHNSRACWKIAALFAVAAMAQPVVAQSVTPGSGVASTRDSEFRDGVTVEFLYREDIGHPYHTDWYGRVEKRDGDWRDVYYETSDKFVNKGIVSFNCADPRADIGVITYDVGTYGDPADRRFVRVRYADRAAWDERRLPGLWGEVPTLEIYRVMAKKYCKKSGGDK